MNAKNVRSKAKYLASKQIGLIYITLNTYGTITACD